MTKRTFFGLNNHKVTSRGLFKFKLFKQHFPVKVGVSKGMFIYYRRGLVGRKVAGLRKLLKVGRGRMKKFGPHEGGLGK